MNAYTKFVKNPSFRSQDIERQRNYDGKMEQWKDRMTDNPSQVRCDISFKFCSCVFVLLGNI